MPANFDDEMDRANLNKEISKALLFIMLGMAIHVVDISFSRTVNGEGFRFDLINDLIGIGMIILAIGQLRRIRINEKYQQYMTFALVAAGVQMVWDLEGHMLYVRPYFLWVLSLICGFLVLGGILLLLESLLILSSGLSLNKSPFNLKLAKRLFIYLEIVPSVVVVGLLLLSGSDVIFFGPGNSLNWIVGILIILLKLIAYATIVFAIYQMRQEVIAKDREI